MGIRSDLILTWCPRDNPIAAQETDEIFYLWRYAKVAYIADT